jgi:hypothetical protein
MLRMLCQLFVNCHSGSPIWREIEYCERLRMKKTLKSTKDQWSNVVPCKGNIHYSLQKILKYIAQNP